MKVKIMQRSVYYKMATIELEIDDKQLVQYRGTLDYLNENENVWVDKLYNALDESDLESGNGINSHPAWTDHTEDLELRYEQEDGIGGHL